MLADERHERIINIVDSKRSVSVQELSEILEVSESTIRRDVNILGEAKRLRRVHGGAVSMEEENSFTEPSMEKKSSLNTEKKSAIAKYAASLISDDDFVFLDAGTTTYAMIEYLNCSGATFVTNGISHALALTRRGYDVIILSGKIKSNTEAVVGSECLTTLDKYNFTKCFVGTNAIDLDVGFTTPDLVEAKIKECAIGHSYVGYVLCDSTKFNKTSSVRFAKIDELCIITDKIIDNRYTDKCIIKEVI